MMKHESATTTEIWKACFRTWRISKQVFQQLGYIPNLCRVHNIEAAFRKFIEFAKTIVNSFGKIRIQTFPGIDKKYSLVNFKFLKN